MASSNKTMTLSVLSPELIEMFVIPRASDIVICDTRSYSIQHLPLSWQFALCEIIKSSLLWIKLQQSWKASAPLSSWLCDWQGPDGEEASRFVFLLVDLLFLSVSTARLALLLGYTRCRILNIWLAKHLIWQRGSCWVFYFYDSECCNYTFICLGTTGINTAYSNTHTM